MTTVRQLLTIALLLAAAALAACTQPTYFRHPISPPGETGIDERLIGSWVAQTEGDGFYQLGIAPYEPEGETRMLAITGLFAEATGRAEHGAVLAWSPRVAHASVIDGETYYNVRVPGTGKRVLAVEVGETGIRELVPEGFSSQEHTDREYWIVKPVITDDGLLWLRFIELLSMLDEVGDEQGTIERYLGSHLEGASFWEEESCGDLCRYARADLEPSSLIGLIRAVPDDMVFSLVAGPFARLDSSLPEISVRVKGGKEG